MISSGTAKNPSFEEWTDLIEKFMDNIKRIINKIAYINNLRIKLEQTLIEDLVEKY
ncbi:MAG: hypothetical protein ACRD8K_06820 [Nitrososphaeraceae archaeon]